MLVGGTLRLSGSNPMRQYGAVRAAPVSTRVGIAARRLVRLGEGGMPATASVPAGQEPPAAWVLCETVGALAATTTLRAEHALTAGMLRVQLLAASLSGGTATVADMVRLVSLATTQTSGHVIGAGLDGVAALAAAQASAHGMAAGLGLLVGLASAQTSGHVATADLTGTAAMAADLTSAGDVLTAAQVWAAVLDSGYSAGDIMRLLAAIAGGKTTISGSLPTVVFRDLGDTRDRVTADMDESERVTVTLDIEEP